MPNSPAKMPASPNDLLDALNFRYATKAFDPGKKIVPETWRAIESSLALTPSSFGLQPWKFLVIDSLDIREKLRAASWGQSQVTDASHFIVLTARTDLGQGDIDRWIDRLSQVQGTPLESLAGLSSVITSFAGNMNPLEKKSWNTRQVYIALGQLMTAAAMLGIDSCPMEGISPAEYDDILGLSNTGYATAVGCALGYRAADDKSASAKKARYAESDVIEHI